MAFSNSSYFAGIGTVCAAITLGFAVGAMVTTGGVQPPNRLERVASSAQLPSSTPERAGMPKPASSEQPTAAAAVPAQASDPQPVVEPPLPSAPPAMAKTEDAATPNAQQLPSAPAITAKSEEAATPRDEHASVRAAELKREVYRNRAEERKFAERRRRQGIDDAANAVRQMRRDGVIDQVTQRDEKPRFGFFGND